MASRFGEYDSALRTATLSSGSSQSRIVFSESRSHFVFWVGVVSTRRARKNCSSETKPCRLHPRKPHQHAPSPCRCRGRVLSTSGCKECGRRRGTGPSERHATSPTRKQL